MNIKKIRRWFWNPFRRLTDSHVHVGYYAGIMSGIIYIICLVQMVLTVFVKVGRSSDPTEVYLRNYSSIIALMLVAEFLRQYYNIHSDDYTGKYMKYIKKISIALAVVSGIKVVISLIYSLRYYADTNIVFAYFLGEFVAWTIIGLFAIAYYKRLKK